MAKAKMSHTRFDHGRRKRAAPKCEKRQGGGEQIEPMPITHPWANHIDDTIITCVTNKPHEIFVSFVCIYVPVLPAFVALKPFAAHSLTLKGDLARIKLASWSLRMSLCKISSSTKCLSWLRPCQSVARPRPSTARPRSPGSPRCCCLWSFRSLLAFLIRSWALAPCQHPCQSTGGGGAVSRSSSITSSSNSLNHDFWRAASRRIRFQTPTGSVMVV